MKDIQLNKINMENFDLTKIYLYKITNKLNNKIYVGVTNNMKRRMLDHRRKGYYLY